MCMPWNTKATKAFEMHFGFKIIVMEKMKKKTDLKASYVCLC